MALRSGCTPGMAGASKALKSLLFDGGDGAEPGKRKIHIACDQNCFFPPLLLLGLLVAVNPMGFEAMRIWLV